HAAQRQTELDQRDGHRRAHSHHHGFRIQHARAAGDAVAHAAHDAVDDLDGGDIDQHPMRAVLHEPGSEILLERRGHAVVHVYLYGDQQRVAELQNGNSIHDMRAQARCSALIGTTVRLTRRSARASASANVALETTFSSTPRCTMVCAICGRMPLTMQSAPINRAAATVLSRCCAVSVSTVGTPVISMMAITAA